MFGSSVNRKEKQQQNHSELQLLISSVVYLSVVCTQTKEALMYSLSTDI